MDRLQKGHCNCTRSADPKKSPLIGTPQQTQFLSSLDSRGAAISHNYLSLHLWGISANIYCSCSKDSQGGWTPCQPLFCKKVYLSRNSAYTLWYIIKVCKYQNKLKRIIHHTPNKTYFQYSNKLRYLVINFTAIMNVI